MAVRSLGELQDSGGLKPLALFPLNNQTLLTTETTEFLMRKKFETTPIFANECKDPQPVFAPSSCEYASESPIGSYN
jgi:hypothetical protein